MKTSLTWLQSHLTQKITAEQAEATLMALGFPLEAVAVQASGDVMLDVEVTSNRPDCLSHQGIARELAAGLNLDLIPLEMDLPALSIDPQPVDSRAQVDLQAPQSCPVYTARVIRGVKVGPSPAWLVQRLETIGLRSVNNIVDVTNYVMMDMGQPLHAFDLHRLREQRIVVRQASPGEKFTAIDGSQHELTADMLVIADAQVPVAVAGVMGGLDSEVGSGTVDVLLEAAAFDPLSIRRTSRVLKLKTDSSYRFERGMDMQGIERASRRAALLIVQLAGGKIAQGVIRAGVSEPVPEHVSLRPARCNAVLGMDLPEQEMVTLLERLGFAPKRDAGGQKILCTVPSHRLDVHREIDLIEEVARLAGYDRLPVRERLTVTVQREPVPVKAWAVIREMLNAYGYLETINFSFVQPQFGQPFVQDGAQAVMMEDERRKREPMLRPSLIPSLLVCRKANQDAGNHGVRVYENASVWVRKDGKIIERRCLGMYADVESASGKAGGTVEGALRDMRGMVTEVLARLSPLPVKFQALELPWLMAGAKVMLGDRVPGWCGQLTPAMQELFELQGPGVIAELELEPMLLDYPPQRQVQPMARFPGIERDLSLVVDETVRWAQVEGLVWSLKPALLESLEFVTTYRGKPIPSGKKSVTLRMVFRDAQSTLRHEQVDPQVATVVEAMKTQLGAELRQ